MLDNVLNPNLSTAHVILGNKKLRRQPFECSDKSRMYSQINTLNVYYLMVGFKHDRFFSDKIKSIVK